MRNCTTYLFGIIVLFGFSNCANGKKIHEEPPVPLEQAYYTTWVGGVKGAGSGLNLFVPLGALNNSEVELDSVYFRGKRTKLKTKPQNPNLYIGYFESKNPQKAPDFVMSSDPREEYGNKPPIILEKIPFELKEDEAVISYKKDGKTGYYKITGIQKKDEDEVKLKNPENIRH